MLGQFVPPDNFNLNRLDPDPQFLKEAQRLVLIKFCLRMRKLRYLNCRLFHQIKSDKDKQAVYSMQPLPALFCW